MSQRSTSSFSFILKVALFATGLSGIVAEYVLATLATYFLGDSTLQWTLILSVMLFAMGVGSRLSNRFEKNLLTTFITIEFALSLLSSFSALCVYTAAAFYPDSAWLVYALAIAIGLLIGLEIPLVTRLNSAYELLKENIASVMAHDYYGSLLGGLFFAFVGLPYLGLTYTPFVLGGINLLVALTLFWRLRHHLSVGHRQRMAWVGAGVLASLIAGLWLARPIVLFGEQARYLDKVIYEEQSAYQKIVMTQWKGDYWLYINGNQQLSTFDEYLYHEPMVHTAMLSHPYPQRILVLGGGDGFAVRDILQYPTVEAITLVDLDPAMTRLGLEHPIMREYNEDALHHPAVEVINQDGFTFLSETRQYWDVILVDLPDPKSVDLGRLYSLEMYRLCHRALTPRGILITQAGSPYYATRAFRCIEKTMAAAGFATVPLHNQVLTLGEWGWVMGSKEALPPEALKARVQHLKLDREALQTQWLNEEALTAITLFGKDLVSADSVEVNTLQNPVLYRYYLKGNWPLY